MSRTKTIFGIVLIAAFFPQLAAAQDAATLSTASKLVAAGQLDKLAALGMVLSVREAVINRKEPRAMLDCVKDAKFSKFSQPIATVYAEKLSQQELARGVAFFESSAGKKYALYSVRATEKYAGITPDGPPPDVTASDVTASDKEAIEAFIESPIGQQMTKHPSDLSVASQQAITGVITSVLDQCRSASK